MFIYDTQETYGNIAIKAQMSVPTTNMMSAAAKRLFCRPNWIGVKIKLKIRLRINGRKTIKGILLVKNKYPTYP